MYLITEQEAEKYYEALLKKDPAYEGIFFVGVKTTGVFCRPSCPARKPKFENCEFFTTAQQALVAAYRPCKRCEPLSHPGKISSTIKKLLNAVEANPERRWKTKDFEGLSVNAVTAKRHFQKRFGMTFVEYARARRMGLAFDHIRNGTTVIESQLSAGYESGSGFRDAFSKIMGKAPAKINTDTKMLKATWIDTPFGPMCAVASEEALYLLEFVDRRGLEKEIERLRLKNAAAIVPGRTPIVDMIESELGLYFNGELTQFKTPIKLIGTPFQRKVWVSLMNIPYGETISYQSLATNIGSEKACRAVANANGANQLAIVIPCHRVINSDGKIGGYGGGAHRKEALLKLEKLLEGEN